MIERRWGAHFILRPTYFLASCQSIPSSRILDQNVAVSVRLGFCKIANWFGWITDQFLSSIFLCYAKLFSMKFKSTCCLANTMTIIIWVRITEEEFQTARRGLWNYTIVTVQWIQRPHGKHSNHFTGSSWLSNTQKLMYHCLLVILNTKRPGASIPLRPWCISPLFQITFVFS